MGVVRAVWFGLGEESSLFVPDQRHLNRVAFELGGAPLLKVIVREGTGGELLQLVGRAFFRFGGVFDDVVEVDATLGRRDVYRLQISKESESAKLDHFWSLLLRDAEIELCVQIAQFLFRTALGQGCSSAIA